MRLRNKYVTIAALLLAGIILITYQGVSFTPEAALAVTAEIVDRTTDRLFGDMGIIKVPRLAPPVEISLLDINSRMIRLSDFKGKIIFLNFWASWCPDCRIEMPVMEKLYRRLKDKDFIMDKKKLKLAISRELMIFSLVVIVGIMIAKIGYGVGSGKGANISGLILYLFCQILRSIIWEIKRRFKKA